MRRRHVVAVLLVLLAPAATYASADDPALVPSDMYEDAPSAEFPDPWEGLNRLTFGMNLRVDRWVFEPLTGAYAFVVPAPGRRAVRRVLANLDAPAVFVNDVLQLEPVDAAVTAARFAVNTTVGLLGIFDVAARAGLDGHRSDFGQTLALCGLPSGPYVIFPVAGPTTARDGTGYVVDFFFRPTTYLFTPGAQLVLASIHEGSAGIATRDAHAGELRALEASSIDYSAALRNAYSQSRTADIWARRENRGPLALARRALARLGTPPLPPAGGQVGDPGTHGGDQGLEAVTRQD
jgi:phospholipid-binding lipoprotein MlaA